MSDYVTLKDIDFCWKEVRTKPQIGLRRPPKNAPLARDTTKYRILNQEDSDELLLFVHGDISDGAENFFGGRTVDGPGMVAAIKEATGRRLRLDVNTNGGDAFVGISLYNALVAHDAPTIADITGTAKSAGTIIASGADTVRMTEAGNFHIHRAIAGFGVVGNRDEVAETSRLVLKWLDELDESISRLLAARSGQDVSDVEEQLRGDGMDGTSFTAQSALEAGFIDEIIPLKSKGKRDKKSARDAADRGLRQYYETRARLQRTKMLTAST